MGRSILHARHLRADGDPAGGTPTGGGGTGPGTGTAAAGDGKGATGGDGKGDENGFPADTPVADMTAEQQVAYWKHQARKHEQRADARKDYDTIKSERDQLKTAHQTDAEKAIDQAKAAAKAEARAEMAPHLVAAELKAALAGKMPTDKIAGQVQFLDHTKFLTDSGEVDTDKVTQYAAGLAPAGGWPDTGQGRRGNQGGPGKGVAAGADMFAASRGKKTT